MNDSSDFFCVDLDRTFIQNDSTLLILVDAYRRFSVLSLLSLFWSLGWKKFKVYLVQNTDLDTLGWRVNLSVLNLIHFKRESGAEIHLVTGSGRELCEFFATKYECFDKVHFSTTEQKLKGNLKSIYLIKIFGYNKFEYIGDSFRDIRVWQAARKGYYPSKYAYKFFLLKRFLNLESI